MSKERSIIGDIPELRPIISKILEEEKTRNDIQGD